MGGDHYDWLWITERSKDSLVKIAQKDDMDITDSEKPPTIQAGLKYASA